MICQNCDHDSPRQHLHLALLLRREWPYVELLSICKRCRRELGVGLLNRCFVYGLGAVVLGAIGTAGFGIVYLIQWLLRSNSGS